MEKNVLISLSAVLFIFLFNQCTSTKRPLETPIQKNLSREDSLLFVLTTKKVEQLGLIPLHKSGFDSLFIRIWGGHSMAIKQPLIELSKNSKGWRGWIYTIEWGDDDDAGKDTYRVLDKKPLHPKSSWTDFEKSLRNCGFFEVQSVPGSGADGISYRIELATQREYKYSYIWGPVATSKDSSEVRLARSLDLINEEFGLK